TGSRRGNPAGQLAGIGERYTAPIMVQVVKLPNLREAALQHLPVGQAGDGLELVGVDPLDELVHQLAPGPEAVASRPCPLGEAGQGALKGMAVEVGQAGKTDGVALIGLGGIDARGDLPDPSRLAGEAHAARPALRQQGRFKPQTRHAARDSWLAFAILCRWLPNPDPPG